jgi:hypothetical protein
MGRKIKDLTGMRFGRLLAVELTDKYIGSNVVWKCVCACGEETYVRSSKLVSGESKSCGCGRWKDLLGLKFGNLLVERLTDNPSSSGDFVWECLCDCGKRKKIRSSYLNKRGYTTSCGCKGSFYSSWSSMMTRCYKHTYNCYHRYGGRGIKVCEEWHSVENFYRDMGDPPSKKHSLGRIDNDKDYGPSNCRWETVEQQSNNKSTSRFLTLKNETNTIAQWSKIYNLKIGTIWKRLSLGWPVEKALLTPVRKLVRKKCNEDFKSVDFPQPQPFTKEVFDEAIAMIEKWDFTIEKGG